jgi:hypothetical protein
MRHRPLRARRGPRFLPRLRRGVKNSPTDGPARARHLQPNAPARPSHTHTHTPRSPTATPARRVSGPRLQAIMFQSEPNLDGRGGTGAVLQDTDTAAKLPLHWRGSTAISELNAMFMNASPADRCVVKAQNMCALTCGPGHGAGGSRTSSLISVPVWARALLPPTLTPCHVHGVAIACPTRTYTRTNDQDLRGACPRPRACRRGLGCRRRAQRLP